MALPSTTENTSQVLYGPVKIEVSADAAFTAPVDIGAANGVKLTEGMKVSKLENDNAVDRKKVTEQTLMIEWEQNQYLNEAAKVIMRGGIDTIVNTAGSAVTGATQTILSGSWGFNTFEPLANQNGSGAAVSVTSVTGSTNGLLVAGTDYHVVKNEDGIYGIVTVDSATVTTVAQNLAVVYNYTPNVRVDYYTGGKETLTNFFIRLTNEDETGKIVQWTSLGIGNITKGEEITYPKYNADDDRVKMPMAVEITQDISLTAGKQLYVRSVIAA